MRRFIDIHTLVYWHNDNQTNSILIKTQDREKPILYGHLLL